MDFEKKNTQFCELIGVNDFFKAPEKLLNIVLDEKKSKEIYPKIIKLFEFNMFEDFFNEMFQHEYAEQRRKGQHFTPKEVQQLLSKTVGKSSNAYDPTAGTGSLLIAKWRDDVLSKPPLCYEPLEFHYTACELSERTVPFLLCNLAMRGMNGTVYIGDVLENENIKEYAIMNITNQYLDFSIVKEVLKSG